MSAQTNLERLQANVWSEAYSHSRHLESMRSQYLGFFFTVLVAVVALSGNALVTKGINSASAVVLALGLLTAVNGLAGFLLFAVVRLGTVLLYYQRMAWAIADDLAGSAPPGWWGPAPATPGPAYAANLRTMHGSAAFVLKASLVGLPGLTLGLTLHVVALNDVRTSVTAIAVVLGVVSAGISVGAILGVRSSSP